MIKKDYTPQNLDIDHNIHDLSYIDNENYQFIEIPKGYWLNCGRLLDINPERDQDIETLQSSVDSKGKADETCTQAEADCQRQLDACTRELRNNPHCSRSAITDELKSSSAAAIKTKHLPTYGIHGTPDNSLSSSGTRNGDEKLGTRATSERQLETYRPTREAITGKPEPHSTRHATLDTPGENALSRDSMSNNPVKLTERVSKADAVRKGGSTPPADTSQLSDDSKGNVVETDSGKVNLTPTEKADVQLSVTRDSRGTVKPHHTRSAITDDQPKSICNLSSQNTHAPSAASPNNMEYCLKYNEVIGKELIDSCDEPDKNIGCYFCPFFEFAELDDCGDD